MTWLTLTSDSIFSLVSLILAAAFSLYLLRLPHKTRATGFLLGTMGATAAGFVCMLLVTCIAGPGSPVDSIHFLRLSQIFGILSIVFFLQFAFAFLTNPFPAEARVALLFSVLLTLISILGLFSVLPFGIAALSLLALELWVLQVLLRKVVRLSSENINDGEADSSLPAWRYLLHPKGRAARAHRAFALLSALTLITGILGILHNTGVISNEAQIDVLALIYPFILLGFITVYVNHTPEPITFQVRLVGLTLATMLTLLNLAALMVIASLDPISIFTGGPLSMPERQTLHFEPTSDGGYRVIETPFSLEDDPGRRLSVHLGKSAEHVDFGFSFPFAGGIWSEAHVSFFGTMTFGGSSSIGSVFTFWASRHPAIAVLKTVPDEMDVYARQDSGRVAITWKMIPAEGPKQVNTAQLTLFPSGAFTMSYDYAGAHVVHRGINPGGEHSSVRELSFTEEVPFTVPAGTFLLEDTYLSNRREIHEYIVPLFWLILGSTLFILTVFPLSFRAILTQPLEHLLAGMRRVDAGEREVNVHVAINDEIGRLTGHFNQMTDSLRNAEAELRAYAEQLEERVADRTAELEASKTQLEDQARRLQELDTLKSRFFANISHELRTPLSLLLGPLSDARGHGDARRLLDQAPLMYRNAERLLSLINQLLDLAKLEVGSMQLHAQRVDLVRFLREQVLVFAGRAEREQLHLLFDTQEPELWGYFDYDKLETITANLLSNAIKFTDAGGKVRLELRCLDETAEITVEDTGVGMATAELAHIFDRFYQVDGSSTRSYEGTGIGLALVKELVELHRGEIGVSSKRGFGTRFTMRLPLGAEHLSPAEIDESDPAEAIGVETAECEPSEQPVEVHGPIDEPLPLEKAVARDAIQPLVLIVEDNPDMRAYLRSLLEEDYRILEAGDGSIGLTLARKAEPDLVLSDLMMPIMDGYELCRILKEEEALGHVPVVLLTARADDESRLEGLGLGADDYIQKPFQGEELLLRVENLIEVRRRLRERFSRQTVLGPGEIIVASKDDQFMERVREAVEAHLGDTNFGVDWLADEVGLSRRQLSRRVKAAVGLSPSGYLRMMRLERAAQLLGQQAGSVQDVAYRIGFRDTEHFSKLFKQAFGVLPSKYQATKT